MESIVDDGDAVDDDAQLTAGHGSTTSLMSMASALQARVPLGLRHGEAAIRVPELIDDRARRDNPGIPQDDGWLRDDAGNLVAGQEALAPFNAEWKAEWLRRWELQNNNDDMRFLYELAGALHSEPDDFIDWSTVRQRDRARSRDERVGRVLAKQLQQDRATLTNQLTAIDTSLTQLRAARANERAGVWAPLNDWLRQRGLTRYLDLDVHTSYFFPFWMRWQYQQLLDVQQRVMALPANQGLVRLTAAERELFNRILDVDDRLYAHPDTNYRNVLRRLADELSWADVQRYVLARDVHIPPPGLGVAAIAIPPPEVVEAGHPAAPAFPVTGVVWLNGPDRRARPLDVATNAMKRAMIEFFGQLPGATPSSASAVSAATVIEKMGALQVFAFIRALDGRSSGIMPFFQQGRDAGRLDKTTYGFPDTNDHALEEIIEKMAPTAVTRYVEYAITTVDVGDPYQKESGQDASVFGNEAQLRATLDADVVNNRGGGLEQELDEYDLMSQLLGARVRVPASAAARANVRETHRMNSMRLLAASVHEYNLACGVIEACAGPTIWRVVAALFMPGAQRVPIFIVPRVVDAATEAGTGARLAEAKGETIKGVDTTRVYYTTTSTMATVLDLGDLVNYITYAEPTFRDWGPTTVTMKPSAEAFRFLGQPPLDIRVLRGLIVNGSNINNGYDKRMLMDTPSATPDERLYRLNAFTLREIVLPALLNGVLANKLRDALRGGLTTAGGGGGGAGGDERIVWPLSYASPPPAGETTNRAIYDDVVDKLSSRVRATRAAYLASDRAALSGDVRQWLLQDGPTLRMWNETQRMSPLVSLVLLLDVLATIVNDTSDIDTRIDGLAQTRDNLATRLQQVTDPAADARLRAPETLMDAERRLFLPDARYMMQPLITGIVPLSSRAKHLLTLGEVTARRLARQLRGMNGIEPTLQDLTGMRSEQDELRTAFISLLAALDHNTQLLFPTTYKKDSEQTVQLVVRKNAEVQLLQAMKAYYVDTFHRVDNYRLVL